jgi:hypothetical protein
MAIDVALARAIRVPLKRTESFELFGQIAQRRAELVDDLGGESEGFGLRGH